MKNEERRTGNEERISFFVPCSSFFILHLLFQPLAHLVDHLREPVLDRAQRLAGAAGHLVAPHALPPPVPHLAPFRREAPPGLSATPLRLPAGRRRPRGGH